ncbi:hypothetical protein Tco_1198049, partial [Tanacetum coccineum]
HLDVESHIVGNHIVHSFEKGVLGIDYDSLAALVITFVAILFAFATMYTLWLLTLRSYAVCIFWPTRLWIVHSRRNSWMYIARIFPFLHISKEMY